MIHFRNLQSTIRLQRHLRLHRAAALAACFVCSLPSTAQSVTFGGPVVGGEAATQIGGVVTSTPLLNIGNPGGIATNKLGTYYITDNLNNAVYSVKDPETPGFAPVYAKLNFSGLNSPTGIAVDGSGNVYVADTWNHRVVELPAHGSVSQQTVPFTTSGDPIGVAVDASGNLYVSVLGAPTAWGSVWKVSGNTNAAVQVGTGLSEPEGLAVDGAGNLFVADYDNNRIVELSPSGTQQTILSLTNGPSLVAVDNSDSIFTNGGVDDYVIEVKAQKNDQVAVLPAIGAYDGLAVDGNDNLFAVSGPTPTFYESNTEVIQLPSANVCQPGGNPSSSCSSSISLIFWIWNSVDLGTPRFLTQGAPGLDFTDGGSVQNSTTQGIPQPCTAGQITLAVNQSQLCSVTVNFAPLAAGPRSGAVQIVDSSGIVLAQLMLYGIGMGPQLSIAANGAAPVIVPVPLSAGYETPSGVGVDAAGDAYVTETLNGTSEYASSVYKIAPSGSQTVLPISNIFGPGRVQIDGAGNLFLPAAYADYEFPPSGSSSATPPTPLLGNLHGATEGMSIDGLGDVNMISDNFGTGTGVFYRSTLDGSLIPIVSSSDNGMGDIIDDPWLMAVDTGGHYDGPIVADGTNLELISPLEQTSSLFLDLQALSASFSIPQGSGTLGVSPGGDIYFTNGSGIYDTLGRTVLAGNVGAGPFALDANGNLYFVPFSEGNTGPSVAELPAIQQPFTFPTTMVGSSSAAQAFTIFNGGNADMNFTSIAASGPFALVPARTTCSTGTPLAPLDSCTIGVTFNPVATGAATSNLTVAVAGLVTPAFTLNGAGTSPQLAATTTVLGASATALTAGSFLKLTATVTAPGGATPQGPVTFLNGSATLGTATLNSAGVAALTLTPVAGTYSVTASYGGSSTDAASVSPATAITVSPALASATTSLSVAPSAAAYGGTVVFTSTVVGSAATPTGTVTIDDGTGPLAMVSLLNGTAAYSSSSLAVGTHSLTANYSGDTNYQSSVSTAVSLTVAPFTVQVTPSGSTTVAPGASLTTSVTVGSANNYAGTVALSCSIAYQGQGSASDPPVCGVNPASVTLSAGGSGTVTLTVTTTAESAHLNRDARSKIAICGLGVGGFLFLCFFRRRARMGIFLALIVVAQAAFTGCAHKSTPVTVNTNPGTGAGTYLVTLASTAGQVTTTQSFTMTVQ